MGGSRLNATGRCIFAMRVSKSVPFNEYWENPLYRHKKPVRNGSKKMMVGDNIYHQIAGNWEQLNSHHSYPDGSTNNHNVKNDTQTDAVLVSNHFFYFGSAAIEIPSDLLQNINYRNARHHRVFEFSEAEPIVKFIESNFIPNRVFGDPFDFDAASSRYSAEDNKVIVDGSLVGG
jgi:hypothetical protein